MPNKVDLTGNMYGKLTVLREDTSGLFGKSKWICQCECGNIISAYCTNLIKSYTTSCGCSRKKCNYKKRVEAVGKRFGNLVAIDVAPNKNKHNQILYICQCDCGNRITTKLGNLRTGHTTSCGCIKSSGEKTISGILRDKRISYRREFSFEDCVGVGGRKCRYDFALFDHVDNLVGLIEYDGQQHFKEPTGSWQGRFESTRQNDEIKNRYCLAKGITLNRIRYDEELTLERILRGVACDNAQKVC